MSRIVCQFSCGAASAVATKITLAANPNSEVLIVNAFLKEEHPDNRRFAADCEHWFGRPITELRNIKYNSSTDEVWRRERFMKGLHGAPCSRLLKRELLAKISTPGDVKVIGFTAEEADRFDDLITRFPEENFQAPLIDKGLRKSDCLAIVKDAGIKLPFMYRIGFLNANCIGCPKGGQNYWQKIRSVFPDRFAEVLAIQEAIGPAAYFLRFRSGSRKGERMGLRELPAGNGNLANEPEISCSFFCEMTKQELE